MWFPLSSNLILFIVPWVGFSIGFNISVCDDDYINSNGYNHIEYIGNEIDLCLSGFFWLFVLMHNKQLGQIETTTTAITNVWRLTFHDTMT